LTGSYRKIIGKVGKGKCRVFRYDRESLMEQENGLVGVEVEFELPASSYATICLRELIGLEVER
jgi:tRNA(Glu) U13 pseudouridine synthase TruD